MGIYDQYYSEFPPEIQALGDADWIELGRIMDEIDSDLLDSILVMKDFWDLDRSPEEQLKYLSYALRANVQAGDAENIKRKKVWTAVARHKVKGTPQNVIDLIEEVTGITPTFSIDQFSMFMIWESYGDLLPFPYDFMKWDSAISISGFGMQWIALGSGITAASLRGIIYVDLGSDSIPAKIIDKVVKVIDYCGAAYFEYHLGNQTLSGWLEYRQVN